MAASGTRSATAIRPSSGVRPVPSFRSAFATLVAALLAIGPSPGAMEAQEPPPVVQGRLLLGEQPADSGTVVLHRVTPEEAGPVDSVRVDPEGRFRITLPGVPTPGSGEVFFASAHREGVLYYGEPLVAPAQLEEEYLVRVYPTRRIPDGGLSLSVALRNVFLETGPVGWRFTDLIELRNDSSVTWVTDGDAGPIWRYPLPPGARAVRTGPAEVTPDAIVFRDGMVELLGPLIPGDRLLVIQYDLEEVEFSLPLPGRTEFLEVLVREPAPGLVMEGLTARPAVELEEDARYLRWTGEALENRVLRVREGGGEPTALPGWIAVGVALLLALVGIGVVLLRERGA